LLRSHPSVLVADNFMLAAEIDFQLDGAVPVYVLDSPLNAKHGRAPQLAAWRRDEAALREAHPRALMLLAVDEMALRIRERSDWLGTLCQRIDGASPLRRLDLFDGRRRVAFYAGFVPAPGQPSIAPADCIIWREGAAAFAR
jgi:hypothetical protein